MRLLRYATKRVLLVLVSSFVVSSVVFIGVHQLPGNAFLSERVSPNEIQTLIRHFHLDDPWPLQYLRWLAGLLHGDLGESLQYQGQFVLPLLLPKVVVSVELGIVALVVAVVLGMGLGVVAAVRQNTWIDYAASTTAVISYSMPNFVIATFLLLLLSTVFYRVSGGTFYYEIGWGSPGQVFVPALALGLPFAGIIGRQTRAAMIDELRQDYVRTAWAKGLSERRVVTGHVLRNALIPVITILGPVATSILTGGLVVENVFGIPGLGREFINTILARDYNMVVAIFTLYALFIGLVNVLVDVTYPLIDPRIEL